MIAFYGHMGRAPRTLTADEQARLLAATSRDPRDLRDHVIFSVALGTGLREHEILGLDCGDVFDGEGRCRRRVALRVFKGGPKQGATSMSRGTRGQEVLLPDALVTKLDALRLWKEAREELLAPEAPLFVSQWDRRLSARQLRHQFHVWQRRAGFERRLGFHSLRHTACSNVYRIGRDIRLTQRFARHASILTTAIYTHPTDEELIGAVQGLVC